MKSILSCCLLFLSFWMVNGTLDHFHSAFHKGKILEHYAVPKYHYGYGVFDGWTGDKKVVEEQRHGGWTRGGYSLLQPNGAIRSVKYVVDPWNGFQAAVHNYGWVGNGHPPKSYKNQHPHSHQSQNNIRHGYGYEHGHSSGNGWGWSAPQPHQYQHQHKPIHNFHGHVIHHGHKHNHAHAHAHPIIPIIPSLPITVKGYIGHSKF